MEKYFTSILGKGIFLLLFFQFYHKVYSQQKPQFTQYIYNSLLLNPAVSGIEDYTDIRIGLRDQWTGISDAPKTFFLTLSTPLGNQNHHQTPSSFATNLLGNSSTEDYENLRPHHGIGFTALGDKYGPFTQLNIDVSYAYHLPLSNFTSLAAGFSAGIYQLALNVSSLTTSSTGTGADPLLKSYSQIFPDLNFGLWLYGSRYFLGASLTNIIPQSLNSSKVLGVSSSKRNYFLSAGYKLFLTRYLSILPSVLLKYVRPNPVSMDLNLKMSYRDRLWLGTSFRSGDSYSLLAGVNISPLYNVGYSYDYTTSALATIAGGTHEIFFGVLLNNINHRLCPRNVW